MKDSRQPRWRQDLVEKLEAVHLLCAEADAFYSAFEMFYGNTSWPTDRDPERRRALNRMSCFVEALSQTLDKLLLASNEAIELSMER